MSFMVEHANGSKSYVSGLSHGCKSYAELEQIAIDGTERCDGKVFYENGNPRIQRDGVDLFPRWVPLGEDYSDAEKALVAQVQSANVIVASV